MNTIIPSTIFTSDLNGAVKNIVDVELQRKIDMKLSWQLHRNKVTDNSLRRKLHEEFEGQ